jgi:hypothetical protein
MKKADIEKLHKLQEEDFGAWLTARQQAHDEMSAKYDLVCVCGRLCTGFHESNCKKFQDKVTLRAIKILESK